MTDESKYVGFRSYQMADGTPVYTEADKTKIDDSRVFMLDLQRMRIQPREPEPWTIRGALKECWYRLTLCWGCLRYGRGYFD